MSAHDAVAMVIYGQLGNILNESLAKPEGLISSDSSLLKQLKSDQDTPDITFELMIDFAEEAVSSLVQQATSPLKSILDLLHDLFKVELAFFNDLEDQLTGIVKSTNASDKKDAVKGVLSRCNCYSREVQHLIGNEIGAVMSLATLMKALTGRATVDPRMRLTDVPGSVEQALKDYFFKKEGYTTVEGSSIVSPVHMSDLVDIPGDIPDDVNKVKTYFSNELKQLRSYFSKSTAETYVRDIIHVIIESAYDTACNISGDKGYYQTVLQDLGGANSDVGKKFVRWFKGFSSMAESAAMRAVEIAAHGISVFQTNVIIAAGAGAFAGAIARKLAQSAFLYLLI
jgi:hypothetical protein